MSALPLQCSMSLLTRAPGHRPVASLAACSVRGRAALAAACDEEHDPGRERERGCELHLLLGASIVPRKLKPHLAVCARSLPQ